MQTGFLFFIRSALGRSLLGLILFLSLGASSLLTAAPDSGALRWTSPRAGQLLEPGTNVTLAVDYSGAVLPLRVEFLRGTMLLGAVTNGPYLLVWSNIPLGNFELHARAVMANAPEVSAPPLRITVGRISGVLTFGLDRVEALEKSYVGIPLWQYLASLIFITLSLLVARMLNYLVKGRLKKWAERTTTKLDDLLLELIGGPIKIVVFVVLLHVGLRVYVWPDWLEDFLSKAMKVIVACSLTYVALKAVDLVINFWRHRTAREEDKVFNDQLFPVLSKSLKIFVTVVAVLLTASNLGLDITSLIASLSVVGLALGLAAQDTVANVFGAVTVFVDKPFRIGDRIKVEAVDGIVESIGLRSTRVRNADGHLITVPNKTMGNATITNISQQPTVRTVTNIGLTYDTTPERVKAAAQLLEKIFRSHSKTHDVLIHFNHFGDSALNLQVIHWWKGNDPREQVTAMQELNLQIKEAFDREKIQFAYPSRTLYLKQDPRNSQ